MTRRRSVLLAALVAVLALVVLRRLGGDAEPPRAAGPRPAVAAPATDPDRGAEHLLASPAAPDAAPAPAARAALAVTTPERSDPPPAAAVERRVVEVVDRLGVAVRGVRLRHGDAVAEPTGADGRVAIELFGAEPLPALRAREVGPEFVALGSGLRTDGSGTPVLVVAPARTVVGRVVAIGDDGLLEGPLAEANVRVADQRLLDDLPFLLGDFRRPWNPAVRGSAADGRFELPEVPDVPGVLLRGSKGGYRPAEGAVPAGAGEVELRLVRRPPPAEPDEVPLDVRVLTREGLPVEGALVGLERSGAHRPTDVDGWCRLTIDAGRRRVLLDGGPPALVVRHAEHGVERFEDPGAAVAAGLPEAPPPVTLRYRRPPLFIEGRLSDADGAPLAGWRVAAHSATHDGSGYGDWPTLGSPWLEGDLEAEVGVDGGFRLGPLLPRAYPLVAVAPDERVAVHHEGQVEAGTLGLEWRLGAPHLLPRLAGRVVDASGAPVEGALVRVSAETWRHESGGGASWREAERRSAPTGPDGRFELAQVPGRVGRIDVGGDLFPPIDPLGLELSELADPEDVTLVVSRQKVLRLELEGDFSAGGSALLVLEVVDAAGRSLPLRWGGASATPLSLHFAHEPLYTVPASAVEARVLRRGVAADGAPEVLSTWSLPGPVTTLRFVAGD